MNNKTDYLNPIHKGNAFDGELKVFRINSKQIIGTIM